MAEVTPQLFWYRSEKAHRPQRLSHHCLVSSCQSHPNFGMIRMKDGPFSSLGKMESPRMSLHIHLSRGAPP